MSMKNYFLQRTAFQKCVASSIAMRVLTQELRGVCGARGVLRGEGYDVTREREREGMIILFSTAGP